MQNITVKSPLSLDGLSIWAMAFGCVIGWGSIVLPGTSFIPGGGPVGTILGVVLAAFVSFLICKNYAWMVHSFPNNKGSYI